MHSLLWSCNCHIISILSTFGTSVSSNNTNLVLHSVQTQNALDLTFWPANNVYMGHFYITMASYLPGHLYTHIEVRTDNISCICIAKKYIFSTIYDNVRHLRWPFCMHDEHCCSATGGNGETICRLMQPLFAATGSHPSQVRPSVLAATLLWGATSGHRRRQQNLWMARKLSHKSMYIFSTHPISAVCISHMHDIWQSSDRKCSGMVLPDIWFWFS